MQESRKIRTKNVAHKNTRLGSRLKDRKLHITVDSIKTTDLITTVPFLHVYRTHAITVGLVGKQILHADIACRF